MVLPMVVRLLDWISRSVVGNAERGAGPGRKGAGVQLAPGRQYRLVVGSGVRFDWIDCALTHAGDMLLVEQGVEPGSQPRKAAWDSPDGLRRVEYRRRPGADFQTLTITGPLAGVVHEDIVRGRINIPCLYGHKVVRLLQSGDVEEQHLGLMAARHLAHAGDAHYYTAAAEALCDARDSGVGRLARETCRRLKRKTAKHSRAGARLG